MACLTDEIIGATEVVLVGKYGKGCCAILLIAQGYDVGTPVFLYPAL